MSAGHEVLRKMLLAAAVFAAGSWLAPSLFAQTATATVAAGTSPFAVAVNPVTNKIYVANANSNNVTVIDGATNNTATVTDPSATIPAAVAVNPVTNGIYVANTGSNNVTVIDGATNVTTTVAAGTTPSFVAVNPVTNKIYVANLGSGTVTLIDGATNTTTTVAAGTNPNRVAVNAVTNKIYVSNTGSRNVTVIDGATNTTTTVAAGTNPFFVAVNPVTNKIYVSNQVSNDVTVLTEQQVQTIPLTTTITPLAGNTTTNPAPTFTFSASSSFAPTAPSVDAVYFQLDTWQGEWTPAGPTGAPGSFTATLPALAPGTHTLYAYATDGQDASSIQTGGNGVGQSSPLIGQIAAYLFLSTAISPPPVPSLSIGDVSVAKPASGTADATFPVTLSAASTQTVTVDFATADGTALSGSDYSANFGTLTFTPGETSKPIVVHIFGGTPNTSDKTFFVNLSNPTNDTIAGAQGIGTILAGATVPVKIVVNETITVTDAPGVLPSAMIGVAENIKVTDVPGVLPSAMIGVAENIKVTDAPGVLPSAMIGVNENIVVADSPAVILKQDGTPPVVTPPASFFFAATEAGGARSDVSPVLAAFLASATAVDNVDPNPQALPPQVNGVDVTSRTLFPVGTTVVTFRFQDSSGNIGTATSSVAVNPPIGGQVNAGGVPVTATDPSGNPLPLSVTFDGVTQPGLITAISLNLAAPPPPSGFQFQGVVFDITTTALIKPPIGVCILGSGFTKASRLVHFENGAWVDVTSSQTSTQVCGIVNSLSPFGVATPLNRPPTANAGANQTVEATSPSGATVTLTGSGTDPDAGDTLTFAWTEGAAPLGSAVTLTVTLPIGTHNLTLTVTDNHGASSTAFVSVVVQDKIAPQITCASPGTAWHASDVSLACTASDAGSGLANPADASFSLSTHVAAGTETGSAPTDSRQVCDAAGNCATAGPISGNMVDKKAPSIAITAPSGTYLIGQAVTANYSCNDAGSGVASCNGPVASGSHFDTASVSTKNFSVSATDNVGNSSSRSVQYNVTYGISLLYDPNMSKQSGSTFPIKIQISDAGGNNRSSPQIVVTAVRIVRVSDDSSAPLDDAGNANPDFNFRVDSTLGGSGGYIFNLSTKGFASGTYRLFFSVAGDPVEHFVPFQVK